MEIATLILGYVRALAWPAVVLISVALLLPQLRELVVRLRSAKILGVEAAFDSASKVLSDPDSSDEEKQVALQIAKDVADEFSAPPARQAPFNPKEYEELVVEAIQRLLPGASVTPTNGPADFVVERSGLQLPVVVKASVRSMDSSSRALQERGLSRALFVLNRSTWASEKPRRGASQIVFVRWSSKLDDPALFRALQMVEEP